jgi:hypothetical protein
MLTVSVGRNDRATFENTTVEKGCYHISSARYSSCEMYAYPMPFQSSLFPGLGPILRYCSGRPRYGPLRMLYVSNLSTPATRLQMVTERTVSFVTVAQAMMDRERPHVANGNVVDASLIAGTNVRLDCSFGRHRMKESARSRQVSSSEQVLA